MDRTLIAALALTGAAAAGGGCSSAKEAPLGVVDASMDHSSPVSHADAGPDARRDAAPAGLPVPASCDLDASLPPPSTLECTGLYTDIAHNVLAPQLRAYAPAVPLWADGSSKNRWIYLPPGTTIDATNPNDWTFPVGTRVWKEFSRDGIRVETRFFEKLSADFWAYGTYQWNSTETSATLAPGGNFTLPSGDIYHIPTQDECNECHGGRLDKLMGFEQVSLGLDGATGLTLEELVKENLLSPAPASTHLTVGDDGTGMAAAPLSWLHINCGVSCHNTDPGALAQGAGMVLKLDPTQLDGRSAKAFASYTTTVDQIATSPFTGLRIDPGSPANSLLYQLIDERGAVQMPPIASLYVDTTDVAVVSAWITAMPPAPSMDAGMDSGPPDARPADASHEDARHEDAHHEEAGHEDAHHEEAGHEDAHHEDAGHEDAHHADASQEDASHEDAAHHDATTDATGDAAAEAATHTDAGGGDAGHESGASDARGDGPG